MCIEIATDNAGGAWRMVGPRCGDWLSHVEVMGSLVAYSGK